MCSYTSQRTTSLMWALATETTGFQALASTLPTELSLSPANCFTNLSKTLKRHFIVLEKQPRFLAKEPRPLAKHLL